MTPAARSSRIVSRYAQQIEAKCCRQFVQDLPGFGNGKCKDNVSTPDRRKTKMAQLGPYLKFNGNCRQALEFYKYVLGGQLGLQTIGDSPAAGQFPPAMKD